MTNQKISLFLGGSKNVTPKREITIKQFITLMKSDDKLKKKFDRLRYLKKKNISQYKIEKDKLPYFTPSGCFTRRDNLSLKTGTYTWLCPIDIDQQDNPNVDMNMVQNKLTSEDSVLFCAKSPSGDGLKAFIRLKSGAYNIKDHYKIMKIIYKRLEKDLGCVIDYAQGKLSQPFYLTFDKNAYVNFQAIELETNYTLPKEIPNEKPEGDIINKDYLIDVKCKQVEELSENFWIKIGSIGFTLGGWYKAGHFSYSEEDIKNKLKKAVDNNNNIKDKKHKYIQIDKTFQNGYDKPIYLKENYNVIIDKSFDYKNSSREDVRKFNNALGKIPAKTALDFLIDDFDFNKQYKLNDYLFYPLFREKELGIIFGITGHGKSILAVQIANQIAKGSSDWSDFKVETKPQNVLYIDFELGGARFKERYIEHQLHRNLNIKNVKVYEYNNYIGFDKKLSEKVDRAIEFIEELAKKYNSKVIFIDNLSNIADQIEQASEADRFISDLYGRMKALDLSIMFVGHTPKIPLNAPLSLNQLKGSSSLTKTFESVVGFKRSNDKNKSYIKQVKSRSDALFFTDDNVGVFEFSSDKGFNLDYIETDDEENLLPDNNKGGRPTKYDKIIKFDILYDIESEKLTYKEIQSKYSISPGTIRNIKNDYIQNPNFKGEFEDYCKNKNNSNNLF